MKRFALLFALLFLLPALPVASETPGKSGKSAAAKSAGASAGKDGEAAVDAEEILKSKIAMAHCTNSNHSLFEAAAAGDADAVRARLGEEGVDVARVDELGYTALHHAAQSRSAETAKLLLEAGADLHAKDAQGRTPVEIAKYMTVRRFLEIAAEKAAGQK